MSLIVMIQKLLVTDSIKYVVFIFANHTKSFNDCNGIAISGIKKTVMIGDIK